MCPVIHRFHTGNRRDKSFGTRTQYQIFRFIGFFTAANSVLIYDLCLSRHHRYIIGSQLRFDTQYQLAHYFAFTGNDFRQIEGNFGNIHRIFRGMPRTVISLGRIQQCFCRDTSFIQADTAQTVFLDQQYAQTGFTGSFGSCISCGTATDDNNLVFHRYRIYCSIFFLINSTNSCSLTGITEANFPFPYSIST